MKIMMVLRSGGDFSTDYVKAMVYALRNQGEWEGEITCLTDVPDQLGEIDVTPIPIQDNWPGWWSKIEMFKTGLVNGKVLYMDLDVFIMRDLAEIIKVCEEAEKPLFLRGAHPICADNGWPSSSIMSWNGDEMSGVYGKFASDPTGHIYFHMGLSIKGGQRGDQGFIRRALKKDDYAFFQDFLPDKYVLFKRDWVKSKGKIDLEPCHLINWSGRRSRPHMISNPFNDLWMKGIV